MLVGDLVYNDDFDINTNYAVFDCSDLIQEKMGGLNHWPRSSI